MKKVLFIILCLCDVVYADTYASCGGYNGIPGALPELIGTLINLIKFLVPGILLLFIAIDIFKYVTSEDPKKIKPTKRIIPRVIAMVSIFFVVTIVQLMYKSLGVLPMSECINCFINDKNACEYYEKDLKKDYSEEKKKAAEERQKIANEREEARKKNEEIAREEWIRRGVGNLDFTCTSKIVKSQFSCGTLRIVEQHLYDFTAANFNSYINSRGGFEKYSSSLGGVFSEYYGRTCEGRSVADFQLTAEYVLGWMYMYGWDYSAGELGKVGERHVKWGGSNYTDDAFYYGTNMTVRKFKGTFDDVISGKNGIDMMSSECGDLEVFTYQKLGIKRDKQIYPKPTTLRELKVGDGVYFFDHRVDKTDESNWGRGRHNVIVGEVYNDHIVLYDGGSRYRITRNYKVRVDIPSEYSEEAEYAEIKKAYGYDGWGARRWYVFDTY